MGIWSRSDSNILEYSENQLLILADLRYPYSTRDVEIPGNNHIHCVFAGNPKKPLLVLIHGYLGGGAIFWKLLSYLEAEFLVILVDMLGMGRSARPTYLAQNVDQAEEFFVSSLESLFSTLGLESFILAGHSLGGYVAGCYTEAHPHRVQQLMLLSAVGVKTKPPDYDFNQFVNQFGWTARKLAKTAIWLFNKNVTGPSLLRKMGPLSGVLLRKYTRRRFTSLSHDEIRTIESYLEQINLLPGSSEYAINQILEVGAWARKPLAGRFSSLSIPLVFYYGDEDWMSPSGAVEVSSASPAPVYCEVIPNAGHHLYIDNYEALAVSMIEQAKNPGRQSDLSSYA